MRTIRLRQWISLGLAAVFLLGNMAASSADDSYYGLPLTQVRFDQMIPMSFPTASPRYDRMRQTTWPLIDPGVARIPTTENLIYPTDQPLLIMTEGVGQISQIRPRPQPAPVIQVAGERSRAPAQNVNSSRPGKSY